MQALRQNIYLISLSSFQRLYNTVMEKPSVTSNLKNKMKVTVNRIVDVKQYNKNIIKRDPELDARWGTICTPTMPGRLVSDIKS